MSQGKQPEPIDLDELLVPDIGDLSVRQPSLLRALASFVRHFKSFQAAHGILPPGIDPPLDGVYVYGVAVNGELQEAALDMSTVRRVAPELLVQLSDVLVQVDAFRLRDEIDANLELLTRMQTRIRGITDKLEATFAKGG